MKLFTRKNEVIEKARRRFWNEVRDAITWGESFGDADHTLDQLFAKVVLEHKKLDRPEEPYPMQNILAGLQILAKYGDNEIAAEHDVIYAGAKDVSEDDKQKLAELRWHQDSDDPDTWYHYV